MKHYVISLYFSRYNRCSTYNLAHLARSPTARAQISQILAMKSETKITKSISFGPRLHPGHLQRLRAVYMRLILHDMRSVYTWKLDNLKQLPTVEAKFDLVASATAFTNGETALEASRKMYSRPLARIWKPSLKCIQTFRWPTVALRFAHVTFNQMRHKMPQSTKPLAPSSPVSFRSLNSHSPPPSESSTTITDSFRSSG